MTMREQVCVCNEIAQHYGRDAQLRLAQEECAELIQAINKYYRNGGDWLSRQGLLDEIADVTIMITQMRLLLGLADADLDEAIERKLNRQLGRMQ